MEKGPVAAFVTCAIIYPICVLSILAPTFLGSMVGVISGWFSGLGPALTTGLAILFAILVYGFFRRRRDRHGVADSGGKSGH